MEATTSVEQEQQRESIKKIATLLNDIKSGMMTTISPNNEFHSRPMMQQLFDVEKHELWFFTGKNTGKVDDIQKDSRVNISFSSPSSGAFVSLYGHARIVDDKVKAEALWNPLLHTWFPQGLEDPNVTLICVKLHSAEYWDTSASIIEMIGFSTALFTGQTYQPNDINEHDRVYLN